MSGPLVRQRVLSLTLLRRYASRLALAAVVVAVVAVVPCHGGGWCVVVRSGVRHKGLSSDNSGESSAGGREELRLVRGDRRMASAIPHHPGATET